MRASGRVVAGQSRRRNKRLRSCCPSSMPAASGVQVCELGPGRNVQLPIAGQRVELVVQLRGPVAGAEKKQPRTSARPRQVQTNTAFTRPARSPRPVELVQTQKTGSCAYKLDFLLMLSVAVDGVRLPHRSCRSPAVVRACSWQPARTRHSPSQKAAGRAGTAPRAKARSDSWSHLRVSVECCRRRFRG